MSQRGFGKLLGATTAVQSWEKRDSIPDMDI